MCIVGTGKYSSCVCGVEGVVVVPVGVAVSGEGKMKRKRKKTPLGGRLGKTKGLGMSFESAGDANRPVERVL